MASERRPFLSVVTAVLLTPEEFPGELGDSYPAACASLDIDPIDTASASSLSGGIRAGPGSESEMSLPWA